MLPVVIVDGYNFVYRAYHVQPKLTSPEGLEVGALYGFSSMLIRIMNEFKKHNMVIAFDSKGPTFRNKIYPEYKAHRPPAEEDLVSQFPLVREAASAFGFNILEMPGYEADDIIATVAKHISLGSKEVIILSSDKDLMQLIDDKVSMYDPIKNKFIKHDEVVEKFGITPRQVNDFLALVGDKSDNIPGVQSIGPKTAAELLNQHDTLEGIYRNIDSIKQSKRKEALINNQKDAILSQELVKLKSDLEINFDDVEHKLCPNKVTAFLNKYGFRSLTNRISKIYDQTLPAKENKNHTISPLEIILEEAIKYGKLAIVISPENSLELYSNSNKSCSLQIDNIKQIESVLADESIIKITDNYKKLCSFCLRKQISIQSIKSLEDLSLMLYATSAGLKQNVHDLLMALDFSLFDLYTELKDRLLNNNALDIYRNLDLPLAPTLVSMENHGIKVDNASLMKLSNNLNEEINFLTKKIFELAGYEFNIASPKQLGEALFDKMQLPQPKTSKKTSNYITNAEILEELHIKGHEIAEYILKWRQISKLKNTYADALPQHIADDGRIHTTFQQDITLTGRLSSTEPNLQNIPVKTEKGKLIRAAFVASDGCQLISADYSQMELRILAYMANIKEMQEAFAHDLDIHTLTAKQVFGHNDKEISSKERRKAKAINFGIIYGLSAFGLAKQISIGRKEAADYIEQYFKTYPGIKEYIKETTEFAKQHGYVQTVTGRKCNIPDIRSSNHMTKSFAERSAINAPIQGSAADITKYAMVKLNKTLASFDTKMILQIHDELIFEAPSNEIDQVSLIIKKSMENIPFLLTNLVVDVKTGNDWLNMQKIL